MLLRNTLCTLLIGSFSFSAVAAVGDPKACSNYNSYYFGNPSAEEQIHLELINRARANPVAEAKIYGLSSVTEGIDSSSLSSISTQAMQPLTFNVKLYKAAIAHSKDMADNEYFAHNSQGTNKTPAERVEDQGYDYLRTGENLAYTATTASIDKGESSIKLHGDLFVDEDYSGRGHRVNILSPKFKEVGISLAFGIRKSRFNSYYVTDDFAAYFPSRCHFITGVVYDDNDKDNFYTIGEGVKGVKITLESSGSTATTANAGGYGIPAENGTYKVTFTHSTLGSYSKTVTVNEQNLKLDVLASKFVSGSVDTGSTGTDTTTGDTGSTDTGTVTEYAVSTYDVNTTDLFIKAMFADGFPDMYDIEGVYAPIASLDTSDVNTIKAKVESITKITGSADNMTAFKLTSIVPVQSSKIRGATYTLPSLINVHELHLTQNGAVVNKLEVLFIYVEANGQGYLVIYGTKQKS
ncbi:MAG: CAP domain-containing protein [Thiotrichaceae bacterium]|nr:CAP domain-containing protein [Thiotrichaceae bacterium]